MFFLTALRDNLKYQHKLVSDFYGLGYWNTRSLSQGYIEAAEIITEDAGAYLRGRNPIVQSVAGSVMGLAKLFVALPVGLAQWQLNIMQSVPKGVPYVMQSIVEAPIVGFLNGGAFVYESIRSWVGGGLDHKSSYQIANEVTEVLGSMFLILKGSESCIRGGGKFLSGFGFVPEIAGEVVTARLAFDTMVLGGTARNIGLGTAFFAMQNASPTNSGRRRGFVTNQQILSALQRTKGNRTQAARLLKSEHLPVTPTAICRRIKCAAGESGLGKYREMKGQSGGERNLASDEEIFSALQMAKGDRKKAASILRRKGKMISVSTVGSHITNAGPKTPLAAHKSNRNRIPHNEIARVLDEYKGNRTKAAEELKVRRESLVYLIARAKKDSPLLRFKQPNGSGAPKKIGDAEVVAALEKTKGNREMAAQLLKETGHGIRPQAISERIKRAGEESPFFKFKGIKGKPRGGSQRKMPDDVLVQALEEANGSRIIAERLLAQRGMRYHYATISRRITHAPGDSPLARFRAIKGNGSASGATDVKREMAPKRRIVDLWLELAAERRSLARTAN